jgi:hypothetical protein
VKQVVLNVDAAIRIPGECQSCDEGVEPVSQWMEGGKTGVPVQERRYGATQSRISRIFQCRRGLAIAIVGQLRAGGEKHGSSEQGRREDMALTKKHSGAFRA